MKLIVLNLRSEKMDSDKTHAWSKRLPKVSEFITASAPDVVGFQEAAIPHQLASLKKALEPTMAGFGEGRGKSVFSFAPDEATPIFYNKNKVRLHKYGTFPINPSGSRLFFRQNGAINRICTWGHFEEITSNQDFWVFNTHLACGIHKARVNQLKIILTEIKKLTHDTARPIFLMGDFNEDVTTALSNTLAEFQDVRTLTPNILGPYHTYKDWKAKTGERLDHIFVHNDDKVSINYCKTQEDSNDDIRMSDHSPVETEFKFQGPGK